MERIKNLWFDLSWVVADVFWRAVFWLDGKWYTVSDPLLRPWRVAREYDEEMTELITWYAILDSRQRELGEILWEVAVKVEGLPDRHELVPLPEDVVEEQAEQARLEQQAYQDQELYAFGYQVEPGGL